MGNSGKGVQLAVAIVSIFVAVGWYLSTQDSIPSFQFYTSVESYLAAPGYESKDARVRGFVVAGSIAKQLDSGYVDFTIQDPLAPVSDAMQILSVRYRGIDLPDLFKDGAEVVVEGRYDGTRFVADKVMAKCPSKYENAPGAV
jgi:cytochrome c-type biogenesis protein CcmE